MNSKEYLKKIELINRQSDKRKEVAKNHFINGNSEFKRKDKVYCYVGKSKKRGEVVRAVKEITPMGVPYVAYEVRDGVGKYLGTFRELERI